MRHVLVVLAAILLTGCGFTLVGSGGLPEALREVNISMALSYQVLEPPVETALRSKLARRGAKIVAKAEPGVALIRLSSLEERREVLSIGADGKALEYRLVIGVRYEVSRAGKILLSPASLSVSRDYSFQLDQILQKELEEEQLRKYLQNELAELVLLRITTGLADIPAAADPAAVVPVN
jgi:LPS-assembly lipoprotein